ncbi:hypothetical protein [Deinococcus arenicola]|uniref:Lipoprotein n=1 Tax=Deinococcus arenicola TaxID=2994950 RepID=A0ABU4DN11_9DEIO|nr:hypothetical protein [Deinococcus sp. ZS9-10]MDV6373816.1 hypothetical protein [Deinococcus sp. ZS9-10]
MSTKLISLTLGCTALLLAGCTPAPAPIETKPPVTTPPTTKNPAIEVPKTQLEIFHKHSASLPVTFKDISGAVTLRLDVVPGQKAENGQDLESGLKLDTTTLNVSGTAATSIKISAPTLPEQVKTSTDTSLTAKYTLVVTQNGKDIASSPVTIQEKLLTVTSSFEPSSVTLVNGKAKATLVLKVSPPLDAAVEISTDVILYGNGNPSILVPLGATYGDGGTMKRDYQVTDGPPAGITGNLTVVPIAQDFSGYRLPGYSTQFAYLKITNPAP